MSLKTLQLHHKDVYLAGTPHGNTSAVAWDALLQQPSLQTRVRRVHCLPLHSALHWAGIERVSWFALDVEVCFYLDAMALSNMIQFYTGAAAVEKLLLYQSYCVLCLSVGRRTGSIKINQLEDRQV